MKLARGFKTYCERSVAGLREEMAVPPPDPIDMHALAAHLDIPVHSCASFLLAAQERRDHPEVVEIYNKTSAFTFFDRSRRIIVYNEEHGPARHRSNLAHELAHALLQHPASEKGVSAQEAASNEGEAAWMGGVLMLCAIQARHIARAGLNHAFAELRFQVSAEMLRFRLNVTGAARGYSS